MFNLDRQTFMIVAIAICLGSSFYLFKENQKQQAHFNNLVSVVSQINNQAPARDAPKQKKKVTIAPEESNEVIDDAEELEK